MIAKTALIGSLTGVRAFAAVWVVLHHLRLGPGRALDLPAALDAVCGLGYLGVDLFGFLSGFVIAHNYAERLAARDLGTTARYAWIRLVRIAPLHWLALAGMLCARIGLDGFEQRGGERLYAWGDFVQQALLVHGWGFGRLAWNLPSWTVSSEWLCYLVFPIAAPWIAKVRDGALAIGLAIASFALTAVVLTLAGHADFNATTDAGVWRIAGEFSAGCWLERAFASGFGRGVRWERWTLASIGGAIGFGAFGLVAPLVACFGVLVLALAHRRGRIARFLSRGPVVLLGDASYAIYILHWPLLRVFAWGAPVGGLVGADLWRAVAGQLVAIVVVAVAVHVWIENPIRRRLRTWVRPL